MKTEIETLTDTFVEDLTRVVVELAAQAATDMVQQIVTPPSRADERAVMRGPKRANGTPARRAPHPARRKGPIQLCPVPGCKDRAAPVFGMVCSWHKDVPKAKIAAYREARRASKATA